MSAQPESRLVQTNYGQREADFKQQVSDHTHTMVTVKLLVADAAEAAQILQRLTPEHINAELAKVGLPAVDSVGAFKFGGPSSMVFNRKSLDPCEKMPTWGETAEEQLSVQTDRKFVDCVPNSLTMPTFSAANGISSAVAFNPDKAVLGAGPQAEAAPARLAQAGLKEMLGHTSESVLSTAGLKAPRADRTASSSVAGDR